MKQTRYQILRAFCYAMEWAVNPETVYQKFVDTSVECFECDAAHLHLLDINGKQFNHRASHDEQVDPNYYSTSLSMNVGRMAWMMENRQIIKMEDYEHPHAEDQIPDAALQAGFQSGLSIPLDSSSGVLGMLSLAYKRPLPWKDSEYDFLLQIGRVLGIFIQRLEMSKKDLELNILRERRQISSEIHDNLSQMISALAVRTDIALECLEDHDLASLRSEIEHLSDQTRQITKVLREEMLSLRSPIELDDDVVSKLQEVIARFNDQWDIPVFFDNRTEQSPALSNYALLQIIRIVNESLQNVLRHSRASEVTVTLQRRNGHVLIEVADNGVGFDIDSVPPERLGLRIMKERAESADGHFAIASSLKGTKVLLEFPVIRP